MLDVASKVMSSVLVSRMRAVMEHICMEAQAGFRSGRGTIDGLFNILLGLRKRQEHNKETWAVFIDLVKAFDTVRLYRLGNTKNAKMAGRNNSGM